MKRDFSESARQELLTLVSEVENEKWCDFTDWLGDRWCDFEAWIGCLDVRDYISNVNEYHKKVIDKNNTTADDINTIFENVNGVSDQYKIRFNALLADIQSFKGTINLLAAVVAPGNGSFNPQFIGTGLKNAVNRYLETSDGLELIAGEGLTEEDIKNMDEAKLQRILNTMAAVVVDNLPDVEIGDEIEIPIGPGVSIYYKVSAEVNGTGDINLNLIAQEQKVQLKDYNYTYDFGNGLTASLDSEGNLSIEASGDNVPTVTVSGSGISVSYETEVGNNTYGYNFEYDPLTQTLVLEESVTTNVGDAGSVTSAVGVKFKENNNWKPLPAPVPVESPYTCQVPEISLPEFDVDWEVVAGVTVAVVVVGAIVLIPATGGASAAALVVV
ncbi:MAG: hypothetical protein UIM53_08500 [Acutalibacteraceae bacterium]|nr:hypothetical protein [Acutalibacteraceae bacterium]